MSGGVCLKSGYVHVAMPVLTSGVYQRTLVHEMTHVYLAHRRLPKWLEEAIAMRMEEALWARCAGGETRFLRPSPGVVGC